MGERGVCGQGSLPEVCMRTGRRLADMYEGIDAGTALWERVYCG